MFSGVRYIVNIVTLKKLHHLDSMTRSHSAWHVNNLHNNHFLNVPQTSVSSICKAQAILLLHEKILNIKKYNTTTKDMMSLNLK